MAKATIKLSGRSGAIALIVAVVLALIRLSTLSEYRDPALRKDLAVQLSSGETGRFLERLEQAKQDGDFTDLAGAMGELSEPIVFKSVKVSAPLLSWSNRTNVVVRVEFVHSGESGARRQVRYLRYTNRGASSWQYRGPTGPFSFYANFF